MQKLMPRLSGSPCLLLLFLLFFSFMNISSHACTGIQIKAKDGSVVYGRTLEFGYHVLSEVIFIPRNFAFQGIGPSGKPNGIAWNSKYAMLGANAFGQNLLLDGLNERGLAVGAFYFPGYAQYQDVPPAEAGQSLTCMQLPIWLLSNCANVDEVKRMIPTIKVNTSTNPLPPGSEQPLHFNVQDSMGNALVIEYVGGKLNVYDNPVGVLTNSPSFDWHMTNLKNYINLSPNNVPDKIFGQDTVMPFGQGSGMLGLPGDYTPPSRFIRAVAYSKTAIPVNTAEDAVTMLFHILDNFDIPKGAVRAAKSGGQTQDEFTLWTTANDLRNKRFYFHTYADREIRMVDLKLLDPNGKKVLHFPMDQSQQVVNLTGSPGI